MFYVQNKILPCSKAYRNHIWTYRLQFFPDRQASNRNIISFSGAGGTRLVPISLYLGISFPLDCLVPWDLLNWKLTFNYSKFCSLALYRSHCNAHSDFLWQIQPLWDQPRRIILTFKRSHLYTNQLPLKPEKKNFWLYLACSDESVAWLIMTREATFNAKFL